MDYLKDPMFLRQLIMDHYEHPRNFHELENGNQIHMSTDSCIDDLTIYAVINNDLIESVSFTGKACTIATASTSMMSEELVGKSIEEANKIIDNYLKMIRQEPFDKESMTQVIAFENVGRQPHRVSCATLGWRGIQHLILEKETQK